VSTPREPTKPRGLTRQDIFSVLGALGGILTLLTAIMFYFGWQRTYVQARLMSTDVSLFGFSTQDYVLRSISSLYLPVLVVFGLVLGWLWVHLQVVRVLRSSVQPWPRRRQTVRIWTFAIAIAGIAVAIWCLLFTLLAGTQSPPAVVAWLALRLTTRQWVVPFVLIIATLTAAYAGWINRELQLTREDKRPLWQTLLPVVLTAGTVLVAAFWMLEEYAAGVGRGYVVELSRTVDRLPRAVVISPSPLGIVAPGVTEESFGAADREEVRYRTTGLRLLARSGGKVLLVHDGWAPGNGTVIVLPDSDQLSWQFSR
jgi:hypothetical protein